MLSASVISHVPDDFVEISLFKVDFSEIKFEDYETIFNLINSVK